MKKYTLKIYPDSVLRDIALHVSEINHVVRHLLKCMSGIMYEHSAVGLAAPQVGVLKRILIADKGDGLITMINPEIITGFGNEKMEEGCLSLPDTRVIVDRKESLFVKYIDKNENEKEREFRGLTARVIQHEVDHLNGVLIIDHAPLTERLKRKIHNVF